MARGKSKPGVVRCSAFLEEAAKADPAPVYVLAGADAYLVEQARLAVRECVLGDADPAMALAEFEGSDAALADVLDSLRTAPFLAPRRLVVVREADRFVTEHRGALERYLDAPSPTGSLSLEVSSWNAETNLSKRAAKIGYVVQCEADRPDRIPGWLQTMARKKYNKTLDRAAVELLIEYLGTGMGDLVPALDLLDLYTGDSDRIGEPDVDALVARGQHERVWALCDAVAGRRLARALELLDAFWADGMAAPQIVGLLRKEIRQLVLVNALNRRMSLEAAVNQAGAPRAAMSRIRLALQTSCDEHLADAYQALVDADLEAKTTANDRLAMETLLHRLCGPVARPPAGGT